MKNKKLKILFRTSGGRAESKELGFGHIFRTMHLAKNLSSNNLFFLIEDYGGIKKILPKNKNNIFYIKKNIDEKDDIDKTINFIQEKKIDIVIVDKYKTSKNYLREIKKFSKLVYISDLNEIDYPADLLIDGFIGLKETQRKNKFGTNCLLGPSYQIINPNFSHKVKIKKKYDLLISFGGFDEKNIIENILDTIVNESNFSKIKIILGPGTKMSQKIMKISKASNNRIILVQSVKNMHKEISLSKFGICSGGLTTYEFASQKVPFAIICQVKHQLLTATEWEKLKIAKNLGIMNQTTQKKISKLLKQISEKNTGLKTNSIIDGYGSKRVAKAIMNLGKSSSNLIK